MPICSLNVLMPSSGMDEIGDKQLTETMAYALWRSYTLRMKHRNLDEAWAQNVMALAENSDSKRSNFQWAEHPVGDIPRPLQALAMPSEPGQHDARPSATATLRSFR